jgi:RNA polymerase primary sigma factor
MSSTMAPPASKTSQAAQTPLTSYIREVNGTQLLTAQQEKILGQRIQEGDVEARDHLIRANLRFVIRIARQFQGRGLTLEDMVQEGNMGLMRAAEAFDPEHGTRFTTYAKFWITQSIQRALCNQTRSVRVPHYAHDLAKKWRQAESQLTDQLGCKPSADEVAARIGATRRQRTIIQEALRVQEHSNGTGEETDKASTLDNLTDWHWHGPEDRTTQREELEKMFTLIDRLDEREVAILRLRYGLTGEEPQTLVAIGRHLDLTRERVRQLEVQALRKLRDQMEYEWN